MSKDQTHEFQNIACFTKSRKSYFIREREIDDRWISMIKINEKIWTYLEKGVFSFVDFSSWIVDVFAKSLFSSKALFFNWSCFVSFRFILLYTDFSWRNISLNREKERGSNLLAFFVSTTENAKTNQLCAVIIITHIGLRILTMAALITVFLFLGFKIYFSCKKRLQNELLIHKNIFNLLSVWQNLVLFISY